MPDTSLLFFRYAVPHPDSEFAFDDKRLGVWNKRDGSVVDLLTSDPRIPMQIESVMRDPERWFQIACEAVGKPRYSFALDRITPLLPFTTPLDVGIAGAQDTQWFPPSRVCAPHQLEASERCTPALYAGTWTPSTAGDAGFTLRVAALGFRNTDAERVSHLVPLPCALLQAPGTETAPELDLELVLDGQRSHHAWPVHNSSPEVQGFSLSEVVASRSEPWKQVAIELDGNIVLSIASRAQGTEQRGDSPS